MGASHQVLAESHGRPSRAFLGMHQTSSIYQTETALTYWKSNKNVERLKEVMWHPYFILLKTTTLVGKISRVRPKPVTEVRTIKQRTLNTMKSLKIILDWALPLMKVYHRDTTWHDIEWQVKRAITYDRKHQLKNGHVNDTWSKIQGPKKKKVFQDVID